MKQNKTPGLTEAQLEIINSILKKNLNNSTKIKVKIYFFGSRVEGNFRQNSDLDLLIDAEKKLPLSKISSLRGDFEESKLPFKIDLIESKRMPNDILKSIEQLPKVLFYSN